MILFKACPRCSGDLRLESDMYGPYAQCLQCGHMADFKDENAAAKFVATTASRVAKRITDAAA